MDLEFRARSNHLTWIMWALKAPQSTSAKMIRSMTREENIELIPGASFPILCRHAEDLGQSSWRPTR